MGHILEMSVLNCALHELCRLLKSFSTINLNMHRHPYRVVRLDFLLNANPRQGTHFSSFLLCCDSTAWRCWHVFLFDLSWWNRVMLGTIALWQCTNWHPVGFRHFSSVVFYQNVQNVLLSQPGTSMWLNACILAFKNFVLFPLFINIMCIFCTDWSLGTATSLP